MGGAARPDDAVIAVPLPARHRLKVVVDGVDEWI